MIPVYIHLSYVRLHEKCNGFVFVIFIGKLQDMELGDDKSSDEEDNAEEEDEPDKQMGDVDDQQESLDEKMWGDSDGEDEGEEEEKKEQKGEGAEGKSESQIVAKEDNEGKLCRHIM